MRKKPWAMPYANDWKVESFLGINNVDPAEKCKAGELQVAKNVNITATGEIMTRDGSSRVFAVGAPHSPFSDGRIALFREGTELTRFFPDYTTAVIKADILGELEMHYLSLNGNIYHTDGVLCGITDGINWRKWGMDVPQPPLAAETVGNLIPGRYLAAVTHLRPDYFGYEESGASPAVAVDVTQGGIAFSNLPVSTDPFVTHTAIYLTTSGGEVLYQAIIVPNGTLVASYQNNANELRTVLSTQFLSPPPAGHMIQFFNGRIYIVQGAYVWYTEPYRYGLVNLAHNHMTFDSRVKVFAPVTDGIWVATENLTQFLPGKDPEDGFKPVTKAEHGAIECSQQLTTDFGKGGEEVRLWVWASADGICYGGEGGLFKNLSQAKYTIPGSPSKSATVILDKDEGSFYIVSLV